MQEKATLNRVISLPLLVFYGVGTILGAGIYVLTGKIAGISGVYAPFSFLVSAIIAAFVAFTYAELSSRYPKSAGEAEYVNNAFSKPWLTGLIGWSIVFAGIVSAGVMARGFHGYLIELLNFDFPSELSIILFVLLITSIAISGVSLSVKFAAAVTFIEIGGILVVLFIASEDFVLVFERWREFIPPMTLEVWRTIVVGAFIAFYAFIGFEDMVNVAEEVVNPEKNLPTAIIIALVVTTIIYVLVAMALVLALPIERLANNNAPFALIVEEKSSFPVSFISLISLIAILNGAMIQIIMASRVLYGMAEKGIVPGFFRFIHPKTRTPVIATAFFSTLLLLITLWLPITSLAKITSYIILSVFTLVSLSLFVIKLKILNETTANYMRVPLAIPVISFILCIGFILLQI